MIARGEKGLTPREGSLVTISVSLRTKLEEAKKHETL